MARPHYVDLGFIGSGHDVCKDTDAVLRYAIPARNGGGRLLSRRSLLSRAVVSVHNAGPGRESPLSRSASWIRCLWALWAGALLSLQGTPGLAGWQWLFLVEGSLPVLLSLHIPDLLAQYSHGGHVAECRRARLASESAKTPCHRDESPRKWVKTRSGSSPRLETRARYFLHADLCLRLLPLCAGDFTESDCSQRY